MKKLFAVIVAGALTGAAFGQADTFRFFFDLSGAAEGSANAGPSANTNPTVVTSGDLYVYLMYGAADQQFNSISLDFTVTGPGSIDAVDVYNHPIVAPSAPTGARWNTVDETGDFDAFRISEFGARNIPDMSGDTHFTSGGANDGANGVTLLGKLSVSYTGNPGDPAAEIRMANGSLTNARQGGSNTDNVYFGFGDASTKNKVGRTSADPDAYITPEPASLALLGLGVLALRRRR